jgi:hypothetical protein
MYNTNTMESQNNIYFNFFNSNNSKLPANIKARHCFEHELFLIPNTDAYFNVDADLWVVYDDENDNLFSMTNDQFFDVYLASDKKSQRYIELVIDSKTNNYKPNLEDKSFNLFEEIFGDLIEKEAPIKKRWRLALDLILNKKIFISKYF